MNGEVCCILQICCPPEARAAALAREMLHAGVFDMVDAGQGVFVKAENREALALNVAKFLSDNLDFAPAGTLTPLIKAVSTIAVAAHKREKKPKPEQPEGGGQ